MNEPRPFTNKAAINDAHEYQRKLIYASREMPRGRSAKCRDKKKLVMFWPNEDLKIKDKRARIRPDRQRLIP